MNRTEGHRSDISRNTSSASCCSRSRRAPAPALWKPAPCMPPSPSLATLSVSEASVPRYAPAPHVQRSSSASHSSSVRLLSSPLIQSSRSPDSSNSAAEASRSASGFAGRAPNAAPLMRIPGVGVALSESLPRSSRQSPRSHSAGPGERRDAHEAAGIEFIPGNGGGAGVRLRKGQETP